MPSPKYGGCNTYRRMIESVVRSYERNPDWPTNPVASYMMPSCISRPSVKAFGSCGHRCTTVTPYVRTPDVDAVESLVCCGAVLVSPPEQARAMTPQAVRISASLGAIRELRQHEPTRRQSRTGALAGPL